MQDASDDNRSRPENMVTRSNMFKGPSLLSRRAWWLWIHSAFDSFLNYLLRAGISNGYFRFQDFF